jgi:hypothetical protein
MSSNANAINAQVDGDDQHGRFWLRLRKVQKVLVDLLDLNRRVVSAYLIFLTYELILITGFAEVCFFEKYLKFD